jgi:hypothetical protein
MLKFLRYLNVSANQIETVDFKELEVPLLQTLVPLLLGRISAATKSSTSCTVPPASKC